MPYNKEFTHESSHLWSWAEQLHCIFVISYSSALRSDYNLITLRGTSLNTIRWMYVARQNQPNLYTLICWLNYSRTGFLCAMGGSGRKEMSELLELVP